MLQLTLDLAERSYDIQIGEKLLTQASELLTPFFSERVLVLTNQTIAPLFLDQLKASLNGLTVFEFVIKDGEIHKNLDNFKSVLDFLIKHQFRRNDTLVALGGGVIGDLGGFVAASYQRGMQFIQIPTTLLAQVDSSVGGKTAVNHPLGKNMIGAFYQPRRVLIDLDTLDSLPEREFCSGLAEVIKYAMLGESNIARLLQDKTSQIKQRDKAILSQLIYHSCAMKAKIVAQDERESGRRALLNLGHTFGHAIEKVTGYQEYLHGEAVAIGIKIAINLSLMKGLISNQVATKYSQLIQALGLPYSTHQSIPSNDLLEAMKHDKKNLNDSFRLILPTNENCVIFEETDENLIKQAIIKQTEEF